MTVKYEEWMKRAVCVKSGLNPCPGNHEGSHEMDDTELRTEKIVVELSELEIAMIGWWWNAASCESKASWDEDTITLFKKLGVYEEPN